MWLVLAAGLAALAADDNVLGLPTQALVSHGSLLIAGGGRTTEPMRTEFLRLAGGSQARIVLIPSAACFRSPAEMREYFSLWLEYPVATFDFLDAASREQADGPQFAAPLERATGVWMPGGDQSRLAALYGGTRVEQAIRQVLERGGVVGGTSAGASIVSRRMITDGNTCDAVLGRGFGLLDRAVVDQHFSQRGRYGRLLKVLEENPGLLGLGVDESTAVLVQGDRLRVLGESRVTLCIPAEAYQATLVYRLKPGEEVKLSLTNKVLNDLPLRVALRKKAVE